jgi:hypothetical protein
MKYVSTKLIQDLAKWLGPDGMSFFTRCLTQFGTTSPVMSEDEALEFYGEDTAEFEEPLRPDRVLNYKPAKIPHPVHFREGMQVRNWLRSQKECAGWTDHEFDDNWSSLVKRAVAMGAFKSDHYSTVETQ